MGISGHELGERVGRNRSKRLTPAERDLYRWILRAFAEHGKPPVDTLSEVASALGLDVERSSARLAEEDLVHRDPRNGEIIVAYPFSGAPTTHRVTLDRGSEVYAMCAVDALGIPFMLGEPAEISSTDPVTGGEVATRVSPEGVLDWQSQTTIVLWGGTRCEGPSAATCCQFVHFFSSPENARAYMAERRQMTGEILALPTAAEAGRVIFGDVLTPDEPEPAPARGRPRARRRPPGRR